MGEVTTRLGPAEELRSSRLSPPQSPPPYRSITYIGSAVYVRIRTRPIASPEVSFDKMCQPMEQSYGTQGHIKMRPAAWSWSPV